MSTEITGTENTFDAKTEALLAELSQAANRKYRLNRLFKPMFWVGIFYILLYNLNGGVMHLPVPRTYTATLALLANIAFGIVTFSSIPEFFLAMRVEKSRRRLITLIGELHDDARAVGPLAQLCCFTLLEPVSDIAAVPLLRLLPRMTPADARHLSDSQMDALLSLLVVRREEWGTLRPAKELPLAILKALEQIGDRRAVEPVKRLTTGRVNRRYHAAARECLSALERHGEERDYHRSLLLASSASAGTQTLLRAAVSQTEPQPELLLRASTEKEQG